MTLLGRNKTKLESWADDVVAFVLQASVLAVSHAVFFALRAFGVHGFQIELIEDLVKIAEVVVFGAFLYSTSRRAVVEVFHNKR